MAPVSRTIRAVDLLAALSAAFLLLTLWVPPEALPGVEVCPFLRATGRPCAGCGLTRGFFSISHGRFAEAWAYHPFAFALYGSALAVLGGPLVARRAPERALRLLRSRAVRGAAFVLAAAFLLFGIARLLAIVGAP